MTDSSYHFQPQIERGPIEDGEWERLVKKFETEIAETSEEPEASEVPPRIRRFRRYFRRIR